MTVTEFFGTKLPLTQVISTAVPLFGTIFPTREYDIHDELLSLLLHGIKLID